MYAFLTLFEVDEMPFSHFGPEETRALIQLARGFVGKLDVMVLCEGDEDERDLNALTEKLGILIRNGTGLTSCGGVEQLQELAHYIVALAQCSRTLKRIVLLVDADKSTVKERIQSLKQSLEAHNIVIDPFQLVSGSIYEAIIRLTSRNVNLTVKIAGEMSMPFERHERDDYAVQLMILDGEITVDKLAGFSKSSDFLDNCNRDSCKMIHASVEGNVRQAYRNILDLLQMI